MRRKWRWLLMALLLLAVLSVVYALTRPHVFMETHVHCIKMAGLELSEYAAEHEGRFPFHPNGYGDALLLLDENSYHSLTGPGYDAAPFFEAKRSGKDVDENECGRVYVQGLTLENNPEIALLFDKLPTPGGDHCHLPFRLVASRGREVWTIGMDHWFVRKSEWPEFAKEQVELLVREGYDRDEAVQLYASKPK